MLVCGGRERKVRYVKPRQQGGFKNEEREKGHLKEKRMEEKRIIFPSENRVSILYFIGQFKA